MYLHIFLFQVKCDHYWPFTEDPIAYGDITVEMLSEEEHTDWVYRNFRICYVSKTCCMALLMGCELCWSRLLINFCPFPAFSGEHLKKMIVALPALHTSKCLSHKIFP